MLQWFERVGYSADIAGLEREFGRALTKLPDWAPPFATKWALIWKGAVRTSSVKAVTRAGKLSYASGTESEPSKGKSHDRENKIPQHRGMGLLALVRAAVVR